MAKTASVVLGLLIFVYILLQSSLVTAIWADDLSEKPVEEKRELLGVLQNVLEKLQNPRMAMWNRKHSRLPQCSIGDYCYVKKGPRFGQLCDCPRASKCNLFFLKCL